MRVDSIELTDGGRGYWVYADKVGAKTALEFSLGDDDLVMWPSDSGLLVSDRYCPHAGADLAAGDFSSGAVVCPYHGHRFDEHGRSMKLSQVLQFWPVARVGDFAFVWVGEGDPTWTLDSLELGTDCAVIDDATFVLDASMQEILENVLDTEHFVPVHDSFAAPLLEEIRIEPTRLRISSTHSFEGGGQVRVRVSALGPGVMITEFGRGPWLRALALHRPLASRKTLVRFVVSMPKSIAAGKGRVTELAYALGGRLRPELLEDNEIWRRRCVAIDTRSSRELHAVRRWASSFIPHPGLA